MGGNHERMSPHGQSDGIPGFPGRRASALGRSHPHRAGSRGIWFGTTRGAIFQNEGTGPASRYAIPTAPGIPPPGFRYYAGGGGFRTTPSPASPSDAKGPFGSDSPVWVALPSDR